MAVTWRACIGQRVFAYKFVLFSQRPPIVLRAGAFGKIQAIVVALRKMEQQIPQENETSQIIQTDPPNVKDDCLIKEDENETPNQPQVVMTNAGSKELPANLMMVQETQ